MKKHLSLIPFFLLPVILMCAWRSTAQNKNQTKNAEVQTSLKVKKNYFITQYPQEFASVQCGLEDRNGHMWFGTGADGIYYYDGAAFTNFTRLDGLFHNDILCCLEDRAGNIWFGTRNGLIRYKPSGRRPRRADFTNLLITENTISSTTRKRVPYTYLPADNFVWSIMQDKTGRIWFGTNKGVYIYDAVANTVNGTPQFVRFLEDESIVNKDNVSLIDITGMLQDKTGNIWFGSGYVKEGGICRYDGKTIVSYKPDGITSFRSIMESKSGDLYFLSSFHGVYRYDGKTFTNFTKNIGITKDTLIAFKEDRSGNLWIGTNSDDMMNGGQGGVWRYDGKLLKRLTIKEGLSHNCVFCILEDRKGNVWFGTRNTGLCRYDGKKFTDFTGK